MSRQSIVYGEVKNPSAEVYCKGACLPAVPSRVSQEHNPLPGAGATGIPARAGLFGCVTEVMASWLS